MTEIKRGWDVPLWPDSPIHAERIMEQKGYHVVAVTSRKNFYDGVFGPVVDDDPGAGGASLSRLLLAGGRREKAAELVFSPKGFLVQVIIRAKRKCRVSRVKQ